MTNEYEARIIKARLDFAKYRTSLLTKTRSKVTLKRIASHAVTKNPNTRAAMIVAIEDFNAGRQHRVSLLETVYKNKLKKGDLQGAMKNLSKASKRVEVETSVEAGLSA